MASSQQDCVEPSGYSKRTGTKNYLPGTSLEYANKLNEFYNRFDKHDFSEEICDLRTTIENKIKSESESVLQVSEHEVCNEFLKLSSAKSAGPQLAKVFTIIFNLILFKTQLIPDIWKRSCIIPVPKKPVISSSE